MTDLARLCTLLYAALLLTTVLCSASAQDFPPRHVVNPRLAEGASDVYTADLDGDGNQDVLSASEEDDKIAWYENSGGDFSSQKIITTGAEGAQSVYSADLDGDGDQDVLSASEGNDEVAWYRNDGGGSFSEPIVVTTSSFSAQDVHAEDLDGDGDQDIISISQNSVAWHENTGNGSFTGRKIITGNADEGQSVHAADLDGDGDLDILSASRSDEKIAWYENEGNGSFSDQKVITDSAGRATSVHAGDLDGDGDQDVVFASSFTGPVGWFENTDGDGSFSERKLISEDGAETVYVSDLDSDGDQDVLTSGIGWFENTDGKGNFSEENTVDNSFSRSVYATDLTGGGSPDIVSAGGDKIIWYQNQLGEVGEFSEQKLIAPDEIIRFIMSVKTADIDGDGDQDILSAWAGVNPNRKSKISWNENVDAPGGFLEEEEITTEVSDPKAIHSTDLTGNGYPDVLIADEYGNKIAWHENNGGSFSDQKIITTSADGAEDVHTADIDGDGDEDVLSASRRDDKIAWYENTGSGSFTSQKIITTDANSANSVYAADLTGNGNPDVLSASGLGDTISWYENDGSGGFSTQKVITTDVGSPQQVLAADLTGNGSLDVLSVSVTEDKIAWYKNTGNGSFTSQNVVSTNAYPGSSGSSVHTADVDGDGDQDILTANFDQVAWYENTDGQGSFSSGKELNPSLTTGRTVYAADITGDGSQDVIVGEQDSPERITWYKNIEGVLPVEIISFKGTTTGSSARLTWQTASETNNAGFEIQQQKERGWTQIGFVNSKAQGGTTTETKSYSYTAEDLPVGTHRFRLRQVDLDGSSTLIDPVTVDIQMQEALKLTAPAPNPVSSTATLSFAVKEQSETTIWLYNTLGQQVATVYAGTPQAGEEQTARVDVSGLSSGTYFLRLQADGQTATRQVTVVR